jgi:hypothetical protein
MGVIIISVGQENALTTVTARGTRSTDDFRDPLVHLLNQTANL